MTTIARAKTAIASTADSSIESKNSSVLLVQTEGLLQLGSEGTQVKDLQAMLSLMGYYSGAIDGAYGDATMVAVRQFQSDAGLIADGVVGTATWQRLLPTPTTLNQPIQEPQPAEATPQPVVEQETLPEREVVSDSSGDLPVLRLDDEGADVMTLQRRLSALNLYAGGVDGVFGLQTEEAVQAFQRQAGLYADGVVGPATWTELLQ